MPSLAVFVAVFINDAIILTSVCLEEDKLNEINFSISTSTGWHCWGRGTELNNWNFKAKGWKQVGCRLRTGKEGEK